MFTLKLQLLKIKHSKIFVWQQLCKQVTKIPAHEKVHRHINYSFKPSLGCSVCNLAHDPAAALFPSLGLTALIQHIRLGRTQPTHFLQQISLSKQNYFFPIFLKNVHISQQKLYWFCVKTCDTLHKNQYTSFHTTKLQECNIMFLFQSIFTLQPVTC
jgi:hypothetical protein